LIILCSGLIFHCSRSSGITTPPPPDARQGSPSPKQTVSLKQRSGSPTTRITRGSQAAESAAILLSDSEDDVKLTTKGNKAAIISFDDLGEEDMKIVKPLKPATLPPVETLSSEDEYAEFVAKARAKARRKVIETIDPTKSNARSEASSDTPDPSNSGSPELIRRVKSQPPAPDPIITILVTSAVEGTKPLLVKRRLSQRLKDVRVGWCDKQMIGGHPVPESTKRQIFLTWRGNKVFDVTTCQAMGLKVNPQGKVVNEGEGIDTEGRIHLEAWTEEIFDEYKKRRAAEKKRHALISLEEKEEEQLEPETVDPKEESRKFKIILKSKDYRDLKLKASATTTVAKIIAGFRSEYKIPSEKDISLHLDGDQLDPASLLSACDVDIEDTTTIDVHVS
jgi:hypothetical protein